MKYRINDIVVGERKRESSDVAALAESIKEIGLINPITIRPDGTLNTGLNRLEACRSLGWDEIEVNITQLEDLDAELAEIDENLIRNELHWADRDKQLKRRKEIYETKHPETKRGNNIEKTLLRSKEEVNPNNSDSLPGFSQDTANKSGLSRDTIEQGIKRATAFTDDQMKTLKQAEVTQTEATKIARLPQPEREEVVKQVSKGVPTALLTSETNEWYTPPEYVAMARKLMKGIDLDPASNAYANERVVQAKDFYDIQANGLDKEWRGRVWLNPPYGRDEGGSNQEAWSRRLIEQYEAGITKEAILLVNANTEAKWFQPLYNYLICFTNHRIRFYNTEGTSSQPTQGNAFIYFGHQKDRFTELFSTFGVVIRRIDNGC
jgi:ParB-like chromosome segregation protein Spo0J